jgi:hypothetical protein
MTNPAQLARCADWAREVSVNPAGTAPPCDVFVLVEHPLPWPCDVGGDPLLAALRDVAITQVPSNLTVRVQAVVGDPIESVRRVVVFAALEPPFAGYSRVEGRATVEDLSEIVAALVSAPLAPPSSSAVTDVLVCTHGKRDTCCGSMGTRLWRDVDGTMPRVALWRTSHTGGHRFAPTAITFPDGNYWAYLEPAVLRGIVGRTLPAARAAQHLRGCAAFGPPVQAADQAALAEQGWGWLDCARFGDERSAERVELCFETPTGELGGYDVCLADGRQMPVPDCPGDPATATKLQSEIQVRRLQPWR